MAHTRVKLWNTLTRIRRTRCAPENLLLLFPICLQNSKCPQKIINDLSECRRCGNCKVKDTLELAERYGIQCAVATGGRLALQRAQSDSVEAIVAVACDQEIRQGMWGVFPKPALGIVNLQPNGPCRDTDVELEKVEEAIRWFLGENEDLVEEPS